MDNATIESSVGQNCHLTLFLLYNFLKSFWLDCFVFVFVGLISWLVACFGLVFGFVIVRWGLFENTSMAVINYSDKKLLAEVGDGGWGLFQLAVRDCGEVNAGISNVYSSHPQLSAERDERT